MALVNFPAGTVRLGSAPLLPDLPAEQGCNRPWPWLRKYISRTIRPRRTLGGLLCAAASYRSRCNMVTACFRSSASIILARLLAPEDFGLVAIVTVLTSFAPIAYRFRPRRRHSATKQDNAKPDQQPVLAQCRDRAGSCNRRGCLQPADCDDISRCPGWSRSRRVLRSLSCCGECTNQHLALLRRTMQFGTIARIQVSSYFVGKLSSPISVAVGGYGYWALVLRPIINALCAAFGAWTSLPLEAGIPVHSTAK